MVQFPIIAGPTAGGKSAIALALVEVLRRRGGEAEIVSADSMQIYRGMDIGAAKPTCAEQARAPHHLIDMCDPARPFSVDQWLQRAEEAIEAARARGATPIVVGGTHLYIKALLEGLFQGPAPDPALRADLAAQNPRTLRSELERVDPVAADRIHPNDLRRTIRAIEVFRQTGRPISALQRQWDRDPGRPDALLVTLHWPADAINRRINARVKAMMEAGLLDEVRELWTNARLGPQAREGLGYKQLIEHLEGEASLDEAVERIKIETRRFAKNQRTWLRRLAASRGVDESGENQAPGVRDRARPLLLPLDGPGAAPEDHAETIAKTILTPDQS